MARLVRNLVTGAVRLIGCDACCSVRLGWLLETLQSLQGSECSIVKVVKIVLMRHRNRKVQRTGQMNRQIGKTARTAQSYPHQRWDLDSASRRLQVE